MDNTESQLSCIILAGGQGKRAGGLDKGLISYKDKPLIEHVINNVTKHVDDIVISANRNIETYRAYSNSVISDDLPDYHGPLAGISACLKHCKHPLVLIVACDMPELPADLTARLNNAIKDKSICIASVKGRHQLAMLVKKDLADSLLSRVNNNQPKLIDWVESVAHQSVSFDDVADTFVNMNRLSDSS